MCDQLAEQQRDGLTGRQEQATGPLRMPSWPALRGKVVAFRRRERVPCWSRSSKLEILVYSYVRNNPLRFFDPSGNACVVRDDGTQFDDDRGGQTCAEVEADPVGDEATVHAFPQIDPLSANALRSAGFRAERDIGIFATASLAAGAAVGGGLALGVSGAGLTTIGRTVVGTCRSSSAAVANNGSASLSGFRKRTEELTPLWQHGSERFHAWCH